MLDSFIAEGGHLFPLSKCKGNVSCTVTHIHPFFPLLLSHTIWNPEMKGYQRKLAQAISEFEVLKEKYLKGPPGPGKATCDTKKAPVTTFGDLSELTFCFLPSFHLSTQPMVQYLPPWSSCASSGSWKLTLVSACPEGRMRAEVDFTFLLNSSWMSSQRTIEHELKTGGPGKEETLSIIG